MGERRGGFIVFEGVDGCGKSTQALLLSRYLEERKLHVLPTREPGGTPLGEDIRRMLLDPGGEELSRPCELLLFMASRAQHVQNAVRPALERGVYVVCERYMWSSLAYQGFAGGLPADLIESINTFATGGLDADVTVILDIDPEVAMAREVLPRDGERLDRIEIRGIEFQRKVRAGFLEIARQNPGKMRVVDASGAAKDIHEQVKKLVAHVI